jgi:hypothetical protein
MIQFFLGARGIDLIVALVGVEALVVLGLRAVTGRGPAPLALASNLLAGVFLLLALRGALASDSAAWIAGCLSAALLAHLADLRLRWAEPPPRAERAARASKTGATILRLVPGFVLRSPPRSRDDEPYAG